MAWKDGLRPASFRGVPFYVEEAGLEGGRRTVNHEFPQRDNNYVEDMGRKARTFPVDAYVLGDDYMLARDALIFALEGAGNGSLVHPYLGTKQCKVASFSLREKSSEGRMARFNITFEESDEAQLFPNVGLDKLGLVNGAANRGLLSLASGFTGLYNTVKQPQFALDSLVGIMQDGSTQLETLFGNSGTADARASVRSVLTRLYTAAPDLVRDPAGIVSSVQGAIGQIAGALDPLPGLNLMTRAFGLTSGANPSVQTATRLLETSNRNSLFMLYRGTAAVEAARAAVQVPYTSYNDAIAARDSVTGMLDTVAETAPDDTYMELDRLRKEVVRALPGEDNDLPRITSFNPTETMPSLALTHYIYGNIDREADIVARNGIRHPGFTVGNRQLEVLTQ